MASPTYCRSRQRLGVGFPLNVTGIPRPIPGFSKMILSSDLPGFTHDMTSCS